MSVAASNAVLEMSDSRHGETRVEIVEPSHEEMNSTVNDAAVVTGDFLWSRSMLRGLRSDSAVPSVAVLSTMTPRMQSFYVQQSKVLDSFAEVERLSDESTSDAESLILTRGNATRSHGTQVYSQLPEQQEEDATLGVSPHCQQVPPVRFQLSVAQATYASMLVNILLFALKLVALVMSGSLSVLSSVVDSALDLFTGVVLFVTQRLLRPKSTDFYKYPAGKQRIEPIAIIICACVMGTASLQLITQAVQSIAKGDAKPNVSGLPGAILGLSVVFKLALYLLCRRVNNPSVQALAVDHRNDTLSNLVAIIFGLMGTYVRSWIDPLGGILIAFYIIVNWVKAGREQVSWWEKKIYCVSVHPAHVLDYILLSSLFM